MADIVMGNGLLAQANAAGVIVQAVGERLSLRGPRVQEPLMRRLIEHKRDVLAALTLAPQPRAAPSPTLPFSPPPDCWDQARALEVQTEVNTRLDAAVAAIPADHPHRQARINVLANERGIIARLMAKRDPFLWRWPLALEHLLERWSEADRMTASSTQSKHSEDR